MRLNFLLGYIRVQNASTSVTSALSSNLRELQLKKLQDSVVNCKALEALGSQKEKKA